MKRVRATHHQSRAAGIIDGDNLCCGGQLSIGPLGEVLAAIAKTASGCPVTIAFQARQAVRYMPAYASLGWSVKFASMAPDAADEVLLEIAHDYLDHHVTDLLVASGDHAFAELASSARLHVCCYRKSLSRRLELAATTVTYLDDFVPHAA